jgi:hypothetical protein
MSFNAHLNYQINCLVSPIPQCVLYGGLFTAMDVGMGVQSKGGPFKLFLRNAGFLFLYNAMQCPMESFSGRRSAWHNVIAGATLGGLGVQSGKIGVPFVPPSFFYSNARIKPMYAGMAVYGGIAGALAAFGGKRF